MRSQLQWRVLTANPGLPCWGVTQRKPCVLRLLGLKASPRQHNLGRSCTRQMHICVAAAMGAPAPGRPARVQLLHREWGDVPSADLLTITYFFS